MASPNTYVARVNSASPTASTTLPIIQLIAAAAKPLEIIRVEINQETSTTSTAAAVELVRSTATAPGTLTTSTNALLNPSDAAAATVLDTGGFSGALTGTQTTLLREGYNILNGFLYLPVPEERIRIAGGTFFWVRLPIAPAATYNIMVVFQEIG